MRVRGVVVLSIVLLMATVAGAQEGADVMSELPEWGTSGFDHYTLHAFEFVPIDSSTTYGFTNWMKYITGGYAALVAGVHLPTGALVSNMFAAVCDDSPAEDIQVRLWQCPSVVFSDPCVTVVIMTSDVLGCDWMSNSGPFPLTVNNNELTYFVEFNGYTGNSLHRLDSIRFSYRLQVSPPPAIATFADVPIGHPFFTYIEALAASGITAGCGGGNYCPDAPLTRGQMAVFLSKALGLHWLS